MTNSNALNDTIYNTAPYAQTLVTGGFEQRRAEHTGADINTLALVLLYEGGKARVRHVRRDKVAVLPMID